MDFSKRGVRKKQRILNSRGANWSHKLILTGIKLLIAGFFGLIICGVAGGIGIFRGILSSTPVIRISEIVADGEATIVYDAEGNELDQYISSNSNRILVTMDQVPKYLALAFVAIEDARFYEHNGIDFRGLARAGWTFIESGFKTKQGASTITQQLLKNTIFTTWTEEDDNLIKQMKRKIQEQYLALEVTKYTSKDDILIRYMNVINLGQNTLGVESASQRYFGKTCSDLTLSECAVIASITQNPSANNPLRYPENNARRRKKCLENMLDLNFITEAEYQEALADTEDVYDRIGLYDIQLQTENTTSGSYFSDAVYEQVREDLIAAGYNATMAENLMTSGGLRIESTMDPTIQKILDEEFANPDNYGLDPKWYLSYALTITDENGTNHNYSKENMASYFKANKNADFNLIFSSQDSAYDAIDEFRNMMLKGLGLAEDYTEYTEKISLTAQPQAAMVISDQRTGYVVAMIGGRGSKEGRRTLNRATDALRSPGSTFKVLASFAPALDSAGKTLATVYNDAPFNYKTGTPVHNWWGDKTYRGIQSIRDAIRDSLNIIAVKNITVITPQLAYDYLVNFGFTTITDGVWKNDRYFTDVQQPLALGGLTNGVSPYELNAAYAAIANQGIYNEPKLYTRVTDSDGNVILDNTISNSHRVIKETTAFLLTDAMTDVVLTGTGTRVKFDNMAIAGKTGTSSDDLDLWFAGFTPYYTATIWTGYDNNVSLSQTEQAIHKTLWRAVMKRVHENLPNTGFSTPATGIVQVEICKESGKLPVAGLCDGHTKLEYFEEGTEPIDFCNIHYQGEICAYDHLPASLECPFKYYGTGTFPLAEEEALLEGSTIIIENEDGTFTVNAPVTKTQCQHNSEFFANPYYEELLNQQQWEMNEQGITYGYGYETLYQNDEPEEEDEDW